MKLITPHIEFLLTENDCVIVPGFGGFVIQPVAARFTDDEVLQPTREVCFNAGLVHDDGLLLSNVSQLLGVSYGEARRLVQNDLELFATELSYKSKIEFGKIGVFSLDEANNRVFESFSDNLIDIDGYALTSVKMTLLSELKRRDAATQIEVSETDSDMIQIRFSKRKALRAAASVAAVWLLWVFSVPVTDVARQTSSAGFLHRSDFVQPIKVHEPTAVKVDSVVTKDTVKVEPTEKKEEVKPVKVEAEPKQEIQTETERYFIVLGSFQSEKSATRHLEQLQTAGIQHARVEKLGSLMRTTLKGFVDKAEAEKYLHDIRYDRDEYKEAWLYCKKQ